MISQKVNLFNIHMKILIRIFKIFIFFFLYFPESWQHFITVGEVLYGGYIFHFIPFFFYDRTLFVHHYLPAYIYKIMLTSFLISHIYENAKNIRALRILMLIFMLIWSIGSVKIFHEFSSLSYGIYPLSSDEVKDLRWKDSWDLIIHKA